MNKTIAIVEDDAQQRGHYASALRAEGYAVDEYAERETALAAFANALPDLAILDIMLGSDVGGGFDVCRFLQSRSPRLPVLFLTSRGNELDRIYGLQLGAWDYQTKPVSLDFLVARIDSLFRIMGDSMNAGGKLGSRRYGDIEMQPDSMRVRWKGQALELTPTEFEILRALLDNADGVSIEELQRATRQGIVEDNTINTHILHIRKKFKRLDPDFDCIKTRYGFGYGWTCA
jgi:two-component system, OmpR family, response regulator